MKNKMFRMSCLPAALATGFGLSSIAAAAAADPTPDQAPEPKMEEIVVTAQSRSQAERDVPIAMDVVTDKQLKDLGAVNLSDLNGYMPGFTVDASQPTQPNFTVRGIGTTDFGIGTDAPVGVYMDGIYTGKTGGSLMNFVDVQRIEVLKGPQGTLFGRNSAAGAISIVSNEPEQALDASALVRYGKYSTIETNGVLNVPLSDTTAVRIAVSSSNSHGWATDQTTGERYGGSGDWGTRASFKWSPSADSKLVATWEHESLDQPARAVWSLAKVPSGSLAPNSPLLPPVPPEPSTFVNPLDSPLVDDAPDRETRQFDGLSLRYEKTYSNLTFSSISAFRQFHSYNGQDNDGTANTSTYLNTINIEENYSLQQEFKVHAHSDLLDWIAGVSFYRDTAHQDSVVNTTTDTIDTLTRLSIPGLIYYGGLIPYVNSQIAPFVPGFPLTYGLGNPWQEQMVNGVVTDSFSLYGDAIWHLTSTTELTTGLRATRDRKDVSWFTPGYYAPALDAEYVAATGSTFGELSGVSNIVFSDAAKTASQKVSATRDWSDLSPRLVLDQKLNPDTMAYASVARGFESGGYDVFSPLASFEPEHMVNYEIGVKSVLPSQRARFNASIFHYKFTNLQNIQLVTQQGSLPVYDVTTSDQHATGLDIDGSWEAIRGFTVFGGVEYMRQNYGTYSVLDGSTVDNLDGQPVGTPLWAANFGGHVQWPLGSGRAEFLVQGNYTSAVRCNAHLTYSFECLNEGSLRTGNAQTKVDTRLAWNSPEHFGVALLVRNVFNRQYLTVPDGGGESAYTLGTPYASISMPRVYLIEFSASL
jgi:iron complex outermembrane receptor protein